MRPPKWMTSLVFSLIATAVVVPAMMAATYSEWVYPTSQGKLGYKETPRGDRIMDFSAAGYMGGGVALPDVPVKATVKPSGEADDTAAIQSAIDTVAKLPLENGFRGTVLLAPGVFTCAKTIVLNASGVVLRGSGSRSGGTTIRMVGDRHVAFAIGLRRRDGTAAADGMPTLEASIADSYVPAGATTFTLTNAKGFNVGDTIAIRRPTAAAWVHFMDMDTLNRDGRPQTWIGANRNGVMERTITQIAGNTVTLDLPLADSYDAKVLNPPGTRVSKVAPEVRVTQVGIEHLHLQCPAIKIAYGQAPYAAVRVGGNDCWVRDLFCEETINSTVLLGKRITMEEIVISHTYPNLGASKPTDFSIEGSQILIDRCDVTGDNEYFVWTGSLEAGPNVILNSTFRGRGSRVQPHQRWSTGLLVDNCTVPDGGIDFMNRGVAGSGHGWTMGWAVAWNCVANDYIIQNPPGAANWAIGCMGERTLRARMFDEKPLLPEGIYDSHGIPVTPQSLYLAQLAERRGPAAWSAIGYGGNTAKEFPNKTVAKLPSIKAEYEKELGQDLAFHRPVNTSNVRRAEDEGTFGGELALDGDPNTYWATADGITHATFEVDMEGPVTIDAAMIEEALGGRIEGYKIEGKNGVAWTLLAQGTTVGDHKLERFPPITVWKVRLTITKAEPFIAIRKFGLYNVRAAALTK
jgi:hypothetical protein